MSIQKHEMVKLVCFLRRKPNMTRREFLDYHFQEHGRIGDVPEDEMKKPWLYTQTHIFDAAFGEREGPGPSNKNHPWMHRDDITELYFRDLPQLGQTFGDEYTRNVVGPDGANFNDFETALPFFGVEKALSLEPVPSPNGSAESIADDGRMVAVYALATKTQERNGAKLEPEVSKIIIEALKKHAQEQAKALSVSISEHSEKFNVNAYFGGDSMPKLALMYEITISDVSSIAAVRRAQKHWEDGLSNVIDSSSSFIMFGVKGVVSGKGIPFDGKRQPVLP